MADKVTNEPPWTLRSLNLKGGSRLSSCPFCSSRRLGLYEYTYAKLFAVDCRQCGAQGPRHSSPQEAEILWNSRKPESGDGHAGQGRGRKA